MADIDKKKKKRATRAYFQQNDLLTSMDGLSLSGTPTFAPQLPAFHPQFANSNSLPSLPGYPINANGNGQFHPNASPMNPGYFLTPQTPAFSTPGTPGAPPGALPGAAPLGSNFPSFPQVEPSSQSIIPTDTIAQTRHAVQNEYLTPVEGSDSEKRFFTFQNVIPPILGTQFKAVDEGSALPKFIRLTMYNVPESEQLRLATKLPISITVRPFAPTSIGEDPIPVVDMLNMGRQPNEKIGKGNVNEIGPPRCNRCRAYMNPMMTHDLRGKFKCNICLFENNLCPSEYYAQLDPLSQRRIDVGMRPELHKGVYDFIVPPEYNWNERSSNSALHHVFLIDVSESSIRQGLPTLIADTIRASLYQEDQDVDDEGKAFTGKISIITFDKKLKFYNLSDHLEATQLTIMADLEDPFIPFYQGLFGDPITSRNVIEDALNHLESLSMDSTVVPDPEPCFAVACRTAMLCLERVSQGGKITSVLSSLPSWGPGRLQFKGNRFVGRHPPADAEKVLYNPDNEYYRLLAKDFNEKNVSLDCLIVSDVSVDLSNVGWLCNATGGSSYKWSKFNMERDGRAFGARFRNSVHKSIGYQGQLKLRCSNGLQVEQYYGTSSSALHNLAVGGGPQDPIIPVLTEDQTFTVLLKFDGKLSTHLDCHFQAALLYTDRFGVRKVRVINLVLAVCERLEEVFNFAEEDAIVATILRDTLMFVGKETFSELRDSINNKLVEVFTQYRALLEINHHRPASSHLLYPESLKHMAMYMLAFLKTNAMTLLTDVSLDSRLVDIYQLLDMPLETLMFRLYPALVELHSLQDHEALPLNVEDPTSSLVLPEFKDLSSKSIQDGVYILCDGLNVYVWISKNTNPLLLKDLFGESVASIKDIDPISDELPDLPTDISQKARNLVEHFQKNINGCPSLHLAGIIIVREDIDVAAQSFKSLLIEDGPRGIGSGTPSFADYVTNLHKAIIVKLENEKTTKNVKEAISSVRHNNETLAQRLIHY